MNSRRDDTLTEGEKKALKADQEGLACAGLGGLWSWRLGGQPIADLDRIDWYERETVLVPDSDVWTLDGLPRLPLKHPLFKRAAAWWREWSKRAEEGLARPQASVLELLQRPDTTRVLHPAQDVADGVLWYGLPVDGALVMITSTRQACRSDQLLEGIAAGSPGASRAPSRGRSTASPTSSPATSS